jgi:hypothetical protein
MLRNLMPKTISIPDSVYQDLASVAEELTDISRKPISLGMAITLLTAVYRAHLNDPCARDAFKQKLGNSDIMSPEEFEKAWDVTTTEPPKLPNHKKRGKKEKRE